MGNQCVKPMTLDRPIPESMKKLRCLFISHFAPERTRTDPYTGLPWYLSERTQFIGVWGKPKYRRVGFLDHCERVVEVNLRRGGWMKSTWALVKLKLAYSGYRPDVVLCGVDECSLIVGLLAGGIFTAPVFSFVEDPVFTDRYRSPVDWTRGLERKVRTPFVGSLLERCAGIFCFVEKSVLQEFDLRSPQIYQMMNGVSNVALEWARSRQTPPTQFSDFRIGYVGALNRRQGVDDLLEIFAQARKRIPRLQLRLIGPLDKEYAYDYQEKIRDLRLDKNVEITGWLPYERMLEKVQECHIGVYCNQPSEWVRAAQPLKVCEYLALYIPTVAWDYPGVRRLLDGGRLGILIPQGQYSAFVDAIVRLADTRERNSYKAQIGLAIETRWSSDYWYEETLKRIFFSLSTRVESENIKSD
jgi:glycosyltransferase involved in cell wall biosynthesis